MSYEERDGVKVFRSNEKARELCELLETIGLITECLTFEADFFQRERGARFNLLRQPPTIMTMCNFTTSWQEIIAEAWQPVIIVATRPGS
jgi:hypothetical protein